MWACNKISITTAPSSDLGTSYGTCPKLACQVRSTSKVITSFVSTMTQRDDRNPQMVSVPPHKKLFACTPIKKNKATASHIHGLQTSIALHSHRETPLQLEQCHFITQTDAFFTPLTKVVMVQVAAGSAPVTLIIGTPWSVRVLKFLHLFAIGANDMAIIRRFHNT